MKRRTLIQTALLFGTFSATLAAADVAGKWVAEVPGRDGQKREQSLTLAMDGSKVTGTMAGVQGGDAKIDDGKIEGDILTFKVTREMGGNTVVWTFTGKVAADEIQFKREGGRAPLEFTAKRAK